MNRRSVLLFTSMFFIKPVQAQSKIKSVATFTILADFVKEIAGDRLEIVSLITFDQDSHHYHSKPSDLKHIKEAQILFSNGANFEPWLPRLLASLKYSRQHITMNEANLSDPHAWLDPQNAKLYCEKIANALINLDPIHAEYYRNNLKNVQIKLNLLNDEIKLLLAPIPASSRKAVTSHESFAYFGKAYGIEFFSPDSKHGDKGAKLGTKALVELMKEQNIKALFLDDIEHKRQLDQIAREAGGVVKGRIYTDYLSKNLPTYFDIMLFNAKTIAEGLK